MRKGRKWRTREDGFTVIELVITVMILGVALLLVTLNYANSRHLVSLKSGSDEAEAAIRRSYNIALQEGVNVYLQFWSSTGSHPDQYTIYRVNPGDNERASDTPTETPPPGVKYVTDGFGHYWFEIANGAVEVQSPITLLFKREGTVVTVSTEEPEGADMEVTLDASGNSTTVRVNDVGEINP